MSKRRQDYYSYLLRVWRASQSEKGPWRAALECPLTGERWAFASLEECWAFLQSQIAAAENPERATKTDPQGGNQCAS